MDTFPYQFQPSTREGWWEVYFHGLHLGSFSPKGEWVPKEPA